jgi:alkanesulfonate monooxygenase SsuD/methylene tetrahydromethanopterin reductase-like flavin-dependent oxidoreductase (luciferase family)
MSNRLRNKNMAGSYPARRFAYRAWNYGVVKIRFAVSMGLGGPDPSLLASSVTEAESIGFDTLWFSDVPSLASTDPAVAVAFAAACSKRLRLGVNFIPFGLQPYLFAHKVAQLDQMCAGRLLVTLVPGLDSPGERAAIGTLGRHRGRMMDDLIPELRAWWSGEERELADGSTLRLPIRPAQDPLEIWLGGSGPEAVIRAGRLADGWLGSLVAPERAGAIRQAIQGAAAEAERTIDPEHFGLSIGYARHPGDMDRALRLRRPRPENAADIADVVPIGSEGLRSLIGQLVDEGLSKFVVRPIAPVESWSTELAWLADTVLDLQT